MKRFFDLFRKWRSARSVRSIIRSSGLFDPEYYRSANVDVALSGLDPLHHYCEYGRFEGRQPSFDFDPHYYLDSNPDLPRKLEQSILHFILHGRSEGRRAHRGGLKQGELAQARVQIQASGQFDSAFYLQQSPPVRDAGIDPIYHYLVVGYRQYLDPSPAFSTARYFLSHPELRHTGENPLLHKLNSGFEGRGHCEPKPDDRITLERMAGESYFHRFLLSMDPAAPVSRYAADAVGAISRRAPKLIIDNTNPHASIIIPVYGQLPFVLSCLDSLSQQVNRYSAEIIVVDDSSPESAQTERLADIPWIRYIRRDSNGGFTDACNHGATVARGKFVIFLNSDTRVAAGWLDELLGSFEAFPKAGLVGSKLFNEDGTLQEAGGIYWRDGTAANYGRNDNPNHPKYCFARQVDYVSGASIAVPMAVWRQMEGFDAAYGPAYCEDSDLAFRLKEAGYEVWLQALSCVVHYEGKTHGRNISTGGKSYQAINMKRFAERWKHRLASHAENGDQPDRAANRAAGDRALFIDALTPRPDHDAGSIFTAKILNALRAFGYQITFVPQHSYRYDSTYTDALQRLGIECLFRPFFSNITDVVDFRNDFDIVFACRVTVLSDIYRELRKRLPGARITFENADLHYLREQREADLCGSRAKKVCAAMTKAAELELMAKVDCTIVHTPVETKIITQEIPLNNIVEIPAVYDIVPSEASFEDRHDIMFLGGFSHKPNKDAVVHFVTSIWPLVIKHLPEHARFVIVGPNPPSEIENLASSRIIVTGFAEDLQPLFDSARVFVAPLRYGAGIKGKVIQSFCHGTPSVVTSIAAEGMGIVSGREAIVADENADFARGVLMAYFNRNLWLSLQAAGYEFVQNNYSWNRCVELLTKALDTADKTWLARHEQRLRRRLDRLTAQHVARQNVPIEMTHPDDAMNENPSQWTAAVSA